MTKTKNIVKECNSAEELEKVMNEINEENNVFATQTHINSVADCLVYTAVFFCRVE